MTTPFHLTGKVAVVTGSSRGIGRAIAETMASLGAKVVISSRKAEACEEVAKAINAKGGEAAIIPCNISRKADVETLVAKTRETFGRIDILVCNAAVNPVYGPLANLPDEAFDKVMGSNVKSNLWLCNLVIPEMAARGDGVVVIISSIAGI
ncbi:MAG: SDR family NAD(P)-dependent oxidoreductase, partial [Variibacter sp.]